MPLPQKRFALALLICTLPVTGAVAQTSSVTGTEALIAALSQATGGETILLEGGDYGKLELLTFKTFGIKAIYDSEVTIKSADPDNPASFSGMDLREVRNLTFDDVVFDSNYTGGAVWVAPFSIKNSTDITIRNSLFEGELASGTGDPTADGFATGKGLTIGGGSDIVIENNEFTTWHRAMTVGGTQDLKITGNDVHDIRSDGMDFVVVQNVLIEDNHIHDFARSAASGDHADMIQFWTNGTSKPSADVTIRGNVLMAAGGGSTQSIFMRNDMVDRGLAGEEMFYRNILIEENVILNGHVHGITVGETDGLVIRRNTLLRLQKFVTRATRQKKVTIPRINLKGDSRRVTVTGNLALQFPAPRAGWTVRGNMVVQDISAIMPGYYHKVFVNAMLGDPRVLDNFAYRPDSPAADPALGAALLQPGADRSRYAPDGRP